MELESIKLNNPPCHQYFKDLDNQGEYIHVYRIPILRPLSKFKESINFLVDNNKYAAIDTQFIIQSIIYRGKPNPSNKV